MLFEDTVYPYLGPAAAECIKQSREDARQSGFDRYNIIELEDGSIRILPWVEHRKYHTIKNMIRYYLKNKFRMRKIFGMRLYYMTFIKENGSSGEFLEALQKLAEPLPTSILLFQLKEFI